MSNSEGRPGPDGVQLYLVSLILVAFLLAVAAVGGAEGDDGGPRAPQSTRTPLPSTAPLPTLTPSATPTPVVPPPPTTPAPAVPQGLPGGVRKIFGGNRILVAYYGTAGTGSLGVLGEKGPDAIFAQLVRAGRPFARNGRTVQPVFELIVTVAHAGPTKTGTYSSDIDHAKVQPYIDAARRHGVLLILDIQPGRANFLSVVKRWEWALKDPWVGLALDPEWRVGRTQVPAQVIGSVGADEVNQVSRWLGDLVEREALPEKVLMLHQFRASMIRDIERIVPRKNLALVQHVDGFGSPRAKLSTYRAVAKPGQFTMGFKLFYDEDVPLMTAAQVLRIRPQVRFVSFQ